MTLWQETARTLGVTFGPIIVALVIAAVGWAARRINKHYDRKEKEHGTETHSGADPEAH